MFAPHIALDADRAGIAGRARGGRRCPRRSRYHRDLAVLDRPVLQIGTSNSTAYALLDDGSVYAWGFGANGQLGDGGTTDSVRTAVRVKFPAGVRIASLPDDVMPYDEGLAIDTAGNVWGWGTNP